MENDSWIYEQRFRYKKEVYVFYPLFLFLQRMRTEEQCNGKVMTE